MNLDNAPTFPPLLSGRPVVDGQDVFSTATSACIAKTAGAGDVFWSQSEAVMDVAIVLEPEVAVGPSLQMLFVAMVAFGDSFGAIGPPEVGVFYHWPNQLFINDAKFGEARVGLPEVSDDAVPDWLVINISAQIQPDERGPEPGYDLTNTSLWNEGAGEVNRTMLVESYARHFLTWINNWSDDGFKPVHGIWTGRAKGRDEIIEMNWQGEQHKGKFLSIDDEGNLLLKTKKDTVSLPVAGIVERVGS